MGSQGAEFQREAGFFPVQIRITTIPLKPLLIGPVPLGDVFADELLMGIQGETVSGDIASIDGVAGGKNDVTGEIGSVTHDEFIGIRLRRAGIYVRPDHHRFFDVQRIVNRQRAR